MLIRFVGRIDKLKKNNYLYIGIIHKGLLQNMLKYRDRARSTCHEGPQWFGSVPSVWKVRRFESHSSCHVWTLGKSFTRSCLHVALRRVNSWHGISAVVGTRENF